MREPRCDVLRCALQVVEDHDHHPVRKDTAELLLAHFHSFKGSFEGKCKATFQANPAPRVRVRIVGAENRDRFVCAIIIRATTVRFCFLIISALLRPGTAHVPAEIGRAVLERQARLHREHALAR
jgi:hypothetical protein